MKKLIALALSLFCVVGLAACGSKTDDSTTPSDSTHTHTYSIEWSKDETYHWHAATCEHTSEVKDKAEHAFGGWIVDKAATEEEEGSQHKICSVCSYEVKEAIVELSHTHVWGDVTYTWSDGDSTCTAKRVCTKDSTHVEEETAPGVYEIITQSTFDLEGLGKYTYSFDNTAFETQTKSINIPKYRGEEPRISSDGKTITYGIYPQTKINDSAIISALDALVIPESNGWYLYDDYYYEKVTATPYGSNYKFDNDETIVSGNSYWFRCEPIVWNVLESNEGEYTLLSSLLLDGQKYYNGDISSHAVRNYPENDEIAYFNTYKYSDLRYWLNNTFYNSAFSLGNDNVLTTTVDNSAETTSNSDSYYARLGYDTFDNVYTLSYQDFLNGDYGFSSSSTRCARTTDYCRAIGVLCSTSTYNSGYWTRSPASSDSYTDGDVSIVTATGLLHPGKEVNELRGVRPAIIISFN